MRHPSRDDACTAHNEQLADDFRRNAKLTGPEELNTSPLHYPVTGVTRGAMGIIGGWPQLPPGTPPPGLHCLGVAYCRSLRPNSQLPLQRKASHQASQEERVAMRPGTDFQSASFVSRRCRLVFHTTGQPQIPEREDLA
jgi:hypothetical protein